MIKEFWILCDGKKIHPEVVSFMSDQTVQIVFLSEKRPNSEFTDKVVSNLKSLEDLKCSSDVPKDYFSGVKDIQIAFTQKSVNN